MISVGEVADLGRQTYVSWREDRTVRLGAGLAYYALFGIVPLLALTTAFAEAVFGGADVVGYLVDRLTQFGVADAEHVASLIHDELSGLSVRTSLGMLGLVSLLVASSLVFVALTDAVNVIWDVPVRPGFRASIRRRLGGGFTMVVVSSGAVLAGFAVSAVADAAQALIPGNLVLQGAVGVLTALASPIALAGALALLYRLLIPTPLGWRNALAAGVATAALLSIGTHAMSWYLRSFGGADLPGAFGAVAATLTWIYIEAQIVLAGVQFTKTLTAGTSPTSDGGPDKVAEAS